MDVRDSNRAYVEEHPELRTLLNDFMTAILLAKPEVRSAAVARAREWAMEEEEEEDHGTEDAVVALVMVCLAAYRTCLTSPGDISHMKMIPSARYVTFRSPDLLRKPFALKGHDPHERSRCIDEDEL